MWPFKKEKPRQVESIGPDVPDVFVRARVLSYNSFIGHSSQTFTMSMKLGDMELAIEVPPEMAKRFPPGSEIRLKLEAR